MAVSMNLGGPSLGCADHQIPPSLGSILGPLFFGSSHMVGPRKQVIIPDQIRRPYQTAADVFICRHQYSTIATVGERDMVRLYMQYEMS